MNNTTPKKKKFFVTRDGVGGQKRSSSDFSPETPEQRKAKRAYVFREKDSHDDSGLDDSASDAEFETPPRLPRNWSGILRSQKEAGKMTFTFSTSTPVKKSPPKDSKSNNTNIWQAALEENPELKSFVDKFNKELAELDKTELCIVDKLGGAPAK